MQCNIQFKGKYSKRTETTLSQNKIKFTRPCKLWFCQGAGPGQPHRPASQAFPYLSNTQPAPNHRLSSSFRHGYMVGSIFECRVRFALILLHMVLQQPLRFPSLFALATVCPSCECDYQQLLLLELLSSGFSRVPECIIGLGFGKAQVMATYPINTPAM